SIELRSTDSSGQPTSSVIASKTLPQASVLPNSWNSISFSEQISLDPADYYAIVLYAKDAPSGGIDYYSWRCSDTNNPYPNGKLWRYINDKNASSTPTADDTRDLTFRVHVQVDAEPSDMANLKVNGLSPSGPDPSGAYFCNFSSPSYSGGLWPFTIRNDNAFNISHLSLSASTSFRQFLSNLSLDIGADGSEDASRSGRLNGSYHISDLASLFSHALSMTSPTPDLYGNPMCLVPINISADGNGSLTVSTLSIDYAITATVATLAPAIAAYISHEPHGPVQVPARLRAQSPGSLLLSNLSLTLDTPPSLLSPIPSTFSIPEEGSSEALIDLSLFFQDDFDPNLTFSILDPSNASFVHIALNGSLLSASAPVTNWSGTAELAVEARDSRGQTGTSNRFSVLVTEVNDPPVIISSPPTSAELGRNYTYQLVVDDDEGDPLIFSLDEKPPGMTISSTGLVFWRPSSQDDVGRPFNITVRVSDASLSDTQSFTVTVSSTNRAPHIYPFVNATAYAGKPYSCAINASDPDGDPLAFSLFRAPAGMSINASSGLIFWPSAAEGSHTIVVNASDGFASASYTFVLVVVRNSPPRITSSPPSMATVGELLRYQLRASDADNQSLSFELVTAPPGMTVSETGLIRWTPKGDQRGNHHVVVRVSDGVDEVTQSFDIEVTEKEAARLDALLWVALALVIVALCGAFALIYLRKRRERRIKEKWPEMPVGKKPEVVSEKRPARLPERPGAAPAAAAPPPGKPPAPGAPPVMKAAAGAPEAPAAALPAPAERVPVPPVAEAAPLPGATRVQDIFVIYRDGRLIHHLTNRLSPMDHEIFASMFSSVQDFMKDSMGAQKVDAIKFEDYNILMEKGKMINLAVVLSGAEAPELRQTMKTSIADIELVCGRALEKWDGEAAPLKKDLELLLKPISELFRTAAPPEKLRSKSPEEYVSILGGVEFYRGFIKLKLVITNDLDAVITDASVKIIVKPDAMRISHIEPSQYRLEGDSMVIGNVQPGEKLQADIYLDPIVCTSSYVDATLTFKDARADLYSIVMPRRRAEVVCPTFVTDQDINVAMLRKMISEFQQHDSKVFNIPEGLWAEDAFRIGMSVIEAHNVRLIREFVEQKPAYHAEAWYYGRTQFKKDQVVMRISVSRETNTLEFFVGSSDLAAITGLLAEFGHELNRRLKNKGIIQQSIRHLDLTEKDRIARRSQLLLHRYSEGEAEAEESEPKK
ncbi:MAG: putative Ig domain-containing protein, partial [Thermoplasmatota archaeon]